MKISSCTTNQHGQGRRCRCRCIQYYSFSQVQRSSVLLPLLFCGSFRLDFIWDWNFYGDRVGRMLSCVSGSILSSKFLIDYPFGDRLDLLYGIWTTAIVQGDSVSFLRNKTNLVAGICMGIGVLQCAVTCVFLCCCESCVRSSRTLTREFSSFYCFFSHD